MADQPKKKPANARTTNDERPNRKAFKQKPEDYRGRKSYRGSKTRPTRLTPLEKALLGGGAMVRISRRVEGSVSGSWKFGPSTKPWDATQARLNRSLYPHLFDGR